MALERVGSVFVGEKGGTIFVTILAIRASHPDFDLGVGYGRAVNRRTYHALQDIPLSY